MIGALPGASRQPDVQSESTIVAHGSKIGRFVLQRLVQIHRKITILSFVLACAALVLFTAVFNMEVARRYFFNAPSIWAQDVISIAALAVTFLTLPYITMTDRHVKIDILIRRLRPDRQRQLVRFGLILVTLLLFTIACITCLEALKQWSRGTQTASSIAIPKWPLLAIMTWGFLSSAIHALMKAGQTDDPEE